MARKLKTRKQSKIVQRIESMSPEELHARWYTMRGRYLKWLGFFVSAAILLFVANHVQHYPQGIVNIINVAFQIFCIFSVMFTTLTAMSFVFGRKPQRQAA